MKITTEQLYARLASLQQLFSYKRFVKIDASRLPELAKKTFNSLKYRPKVDYILRNYVELANLISSDKLPLHAVDTYILGEFIRTGKFPNIANIASEQKFKKHYNFYSAVSVKAQIEQIMKTSLELNTALAKFTKKNTSVFAIAEDQTNELYKMLITGQISVYVYAYFLAQGKFSIDFAKIKDLTTYRNLKIAEYISHFSINEVLI